MKISGQKRILVLENSKYKGPDVEVGAGGVCGWHRKMVSWEQGWGAGQTTVGFVGSMASPTVKTGRCLSQHTSE